MDYELAKRLKEAGFPFKNWCPGIGTEEHSLKNCNGYPALEELISACGDDFLSLVYGANPPHLKRWVAQGFYINTEGKRRELWDSKWYEFPEEAVANLWISLNKK